MSYGSFLELYFQILHLEMAVLLSRGMKVTELSPRLMWDDELFSGSSTR